MTDFAYRPWILRGLLVIAAAVLWTAASASQAPPSKGWHWYKGNLHTHTVHSDGDSSPDFVAQWYKEHGYQFLILSDHNYFTEPSGLNTVFAASEQFLLIGGEEVTSKYESKAVHLNAYGIDKLIPPAFGDSVIETIQRNVDAIIASGGLTALNHPNFVWSVTGQELAQVKNLNFVEVYNGHPLVHNEGAGGMPAVEAMWDLALTQGHRLYGVAVDDAHHFKSIGPQYSNPGRGWVAVKAEKLEAQSILSAIEAGEFYASTGVQLENVVRQEQELSIRIEQERDFRYTTRYFSDKGELVMESFELESRCALPAGARYLRATITDSMGRRAWAQPVFAD